MVQTFSQRKTDYQNRLKDYLRTYKTIIVVTADHVGSHHLQKIRLELRGRAVLLMGKNTLIRMVLRNFVKEDPSIEPFIPLVKGNCGFIFTNEDVRGIRDMIEANKVQSIARPGVYAPNDVNVPPGPTGLDPGQTNFFQVLNIATKIFKGQVEITNEVSLIQKGSKVGSSECALLNKLGIKPFRYGLVVQSIFKDGNAFAPEILDISQSDLIGKFLSAVRITASIGLKVGIPNVSTVSHSVSNCLKMMLAICVESDFNIEAAVKYKEYLENPELFASQFAKPTAVEEKPVEEEKVEAEKEESSEEEAGGGMGGLFGDESESD